MQVTVDIPTFIPGDGNEAGRYIPSGDCITLRMTKYYGRLPTGYVFLVSIFVNDEITITVPAEDLQKAAEFISRSVE